MRFFTTPRPTDESLLWSRDIRFVHRLAETIHGGRLLELESGICLIAPAAVLTDARATEVARANRSPEYGLVRVDRSIPAADRYLMALASAVQIAELETAGRQAGRKPTRYALNFTPSSLLAPRFSAAALSGMVESRGLSRRAITIECTEQQAVSDVLPLTKQAKALRRLGFGFAVDDAGAGYASFTL